MPVRPVRVQLARQRHEEAEPVLEIVKALPLGSTSAPLAEDAATTALATLGYPGFAHRRLVGLDDPASQHSTVGFEGLAG